MEHLTLVRSLAAGGLATAALTGAMKYARQQGWSTLHFPQVLGTTLAEDQRASRAAGWVLFLGNGVLLALAYRQVGRLAGAKATVPRGAALGLLHGLSSVALGAALAPLHPRPFQAGLGRWLDHRPPVAGAAVLVGVHVLYGAILGGIARNRSAAGPAYRRANVRASRWGRVPSDAGRPESSASKLLAISSSGWMT